MAVTINSNGTITGIAAGGLPDGVVDTDTLAADAVTAAKVADNAVTTAKINADAVTAAKVADNAVTTAKINADAVTAAKIADAVVNSEHLVNGGVDDAHLATGITSSKLSGALPAISGASLTGISSTPNRPYFYYSTGNGYWQHTPGTWHKVTQGGGATVDSNSAFDNSNDKFVVPSGHAGVYYLQAGIVEYSPSNALTNLSINIYINGAVSNGAGATMSTSGGSPGRRRESLTITRMVSLSVNDYIELYHYAAGHTDTAINVDATTRNGTYFLGFRMS